MSPVPATDVLPVITKVGCNTGKCHGAASGKDGFRLSLFGYDPDGDHFRITREMGGRRVNLATPEDCLLVNKATGKVPHTGGKRVEAGHGENYLLLVRWLEAGAPQGPERHAEAGRHRGVPEGGRVRREGRGAARRRAGEVQRRHRPRRDPVRGVRRQQRRRRHGLGPKRASSRASGRARRSSSRGSTSSPRAPPSSSGPARRSPPRRRRSSTSMTARCAISPNADRGRWTNWRTSAGSARRNWSVMAPRFWKWCRSRAEQGHLRNPDFDPATALCEHSAV